MCGEHWLSKSRHAMLTGSSPHVRGAHGVYVDLRCGYGIIPACAGSTVGSVGFPIVAWDHPRMCGEHPWVVS